MRFTDDMRRYAAYLPAHLRESVEAPRSTWFGWRGRSVHIARGGDPDAPVRGILVHGGGGYTAALWPMTGVALPGTEVLAPDLPLYGYTTEPRPAAVRYGDWVDLLCDIVLAEHRRDGKPLVLFGASMGGMLAYEAAARTGVVSAVLATCLLDTRDPEARSAAARFGWLGRHGEFLLNAVRPLLGPVRVPIRWLADMSAMSRDPGLARLCATDPRGGGASVPLGFLASWFGFAHTPPEKYRGAPVTLVAPVADTWTPPELSQRFLQRISAPTQTVLLDNCGHYPIEEPGLTQLAEAGRAAVRAVLEQAG